MARRKFSEICFISEGDYKSYDEMVQGALNDDCYQKTYPGIASEVLLENLLEFVQDINNRPTRDGVDHGKLYKKPNGKQIDSSRRYYLVKEPNLDEFNLYVKITKGRNLGYYRIHMNEEEVEILLQYGLNYLKQEAKLPIVADYLQFARDSKHFIARERCEFISRLLNNNVAATSNTFNSDYDVRKLGTRQCQKHQRSKAKIASALPSPPRIQKQVLLSRKKTSSLTNSKKTSRSQSPSPERSQSSSPERVQSPVSKNQTNNKSVKKRQQQQLSKASTKTAMSSPSVTGATATKTSNREKQGKSNSRSTSITHSTPILNRLRAKPNGRVAVASSSSSTSSSHLTPTDTKLKKKQAASMKKRRHSSEDEKDDEHAPVLPGSTTSVNAKSIKGTNGGVRNKRMKK